MNFTEVVAEVVSVTKRPDKISDIRRQVNAAINFCCIEADFARDRREEIITIDSTLYAQSIDIADLTRFRKVDAMRPSDSKRYIKPIDPAHIFGDDGTEYVDRYYIAGDSIVLKLCCLASTLLMAYYSYPPLLTDASPDFWLLDISPYMIIDKAAAKIFKNIGDDASSKAHLADFEEAFNSAKRDYKYGSNP